MNKDSVGFTGTSESGSKQLEDGVGEVLDEEDVTKISDRQRRETRYEIDERLVVSIPIGDGSLEGEEPFGNQLREVKQKEVLGGSARPIINLGDLKSVGNILNPMKKSVGNNARRVRGVDEEVFKGRLSDREGSEKVERVLGVIISRGKVRKEMEIDGRVQVVKMVDGQVVVEANEGDGHAMVSQGRG